MKIHSLIISALLIISAPIFALDKANIQVSAEASIEAMPDYLQLNVVIEKTGSEKANVKHSVDVISQQVIDAANALAIKHEHIEAAQLAIYPQYQWQDNKRLLLGETVQRDITIKLHDLSQYTALADALAKLDITNLQQVGYGFDNKQLLQNKAIVQALKNAKQKAQIMAQSAGRTLGAVYQITENNSFMPMPKVRTMMAMAESSESAAAPLDVKAQTISATVTVIYLLKQPH